MIVNKENIDNIIFNSYAIELIHKGWHEQIETIDNKYNKEFLEFCEKYSEFTFIDKLHNNIARERTNLKFNDVINFTETAIGCGIQTHHKPIMKINEWEKWEDGFIEGFIRMNEPENLAKEYFIWQYIPMKHLRMILNKFVDKLYVLK